MDAEETRSYRAWEVALLNQAEATFGVSNSDTQVAEFMSWARVQRGNDRIVYGPEDGIAEYLRQREAGYLDVN